MPKKQEVIMAVPSVPALQASPAALRQQEERAPTTVEKIKHNLGWVLLALGLLLLSTCLVLGALSLPGWIVITAATLENLFTTSIMASLSGISLLSKEAVKIGHKFKAIDYNVQI